MEFKKYNHSIEEKKISDFWIKKNLFKPKKNKSNKKFSLVIPPPNVTGRLHMGHALNNNLINRGLIKSLKKYYKDEKYFFSFDKFKT